MNFRELREKRAQEALLTGMEKFNFDLNKLQARMEALPSRSEHDIRTPPSLAQEVLHEALQPITITIDHKFIDPACGRGTFLRELLRYLMTQSALETAFPNISDRETYIKSSMIYGADIESAFVSLLNKEGWNQVICTNSLEYDWDMKFDVVVMNPPYNEASTSESTIAGTSGNTTYYRKFIELGATLASRYAVFVVQRNGIRYAQKRFSAIRYAVDTSQHWKYTAGYFIASCNEKHEPICIDSNTIIQKTFELFGSREFNSAIGGGYKSNLKAGKISQDPASGPRGIVELPTASNSKPVYGYITVNKPTPAKPKLLFKGLESRHSYFVTDELSYVGSGCTFWFDTVKDAEKARLFILNNPLISYLQKLLAEKARGYVLRFMKQFDWDQIETGYEYPREFHLTTEEIGYIENNV